MLCSYVKKKIQKNPSEVKVMTVLKKEVILLQFITFILIVLLLLLIYIYIYILWQFIKLALSLEAAKSILKLIIYLAAFDDRAS